MRAYTSLLTLRPYHPTTVLEDDRLFYRCRTDGGEQVVDSSLNQ